ncbi:MAG: hypothetical protein ACKV2O_11120 [Acidimicrobiales bacterium]
MSDMEVKWLTLSQAADSLDVRIRDVLSAAHRDGLPLARSRTEQWRLLVPADALERYRAALAK